MARLIGLTVLLHFFTFAVYANPQELLRKIDTALAQAETRFAHRWLNPSEPAPELGALIEEVRAYLSESKEYKTRSKSDRAFKALLIQTLNHLQHASFVFERESAEYTHRNLFPGQYPVLASFKALEKTREFFEFLRPPETSKIFDRVAQNPELEKSLIADQTKNAKDLIQNSQERYIGLRDRLRNQGPNASFSDQFESLVTFLLLKLRSEPDILLRSSQNPLLRNFRDRAIGQLEDVARRKHPYLMTGEAVERALEFLDVYQRAVDPKRSPVLYHSGRYEYYLHFLKASYRDHLFIPTLANLGATDLLKIRGVPIGFAGVNTDINYVDGYFQTSFEFYIHDVNHVRRMFLFFEKAARKYGLSIEEMAMRSDSFMKKTLIPMIAISPGDSDEERNRKRLKKILFFEMFHEDALAAMPDILEEAILRGAGVLTPFEKIVKGKKVVYVMEAGASTLAYVFRKLAHDFYDMPGDRFSNVVDPRFRTYHSILDAAVEMMTALGFKADRKRLEELLKQDTGLPADFLRALVKDHINRPLDTLPLISNERALELAIDKFEKEHEESGNRDPRRPVEIINFFRDQNRIVVNLRIPVRDDRGAIEIPVSVPQIQYGTNAGVSAVEQLRGQRRVIEIQSGAYLSIDSLKSEFLSRLNPKYYYIVVRSDDPKANAIIGASREYNLESILLVDSSSSHLTTEVSANFIANFKNRRQLNQFCRKLAETRQDGDVLLDFAKPMQRSYIEIFASLEGSRHVSHTRLQSALIQRGVGVVEIENYRTTFGKKTPMALLGASEKMWSQLSESEKLEIRKALERTINTLDPAKVVLVTGGTDFGVEKIVHDLARSRGIATFGIIAESIQATELGPITHAAIVARDWHGKPKPMVDFIKSVGGIVAYFSGGTYGEHELATLRDGGVEYFVMKGPHGAADKMASDYPERAFVDANELTAFIYRNSPQMIRAEYQTAARDSLFDRYSESLRAMGTKQLSYSKLVEMTRGKKVILVNGFVGLGYQNPAKLKATFQDLMRREGDSAVYVGVGTHDGIGLMYDWIPEIAGKLGFKNIQRAAIVSRNAAVEQSLAPMEWVHFVNNEVKSWRPIVDNRDIQVQFLKDTGGKLVAFAGGRVTGIVTEQALNEGLPVEIVVGEVVLPNRARVDAAQSQVLNTVIDGTVDLIRRKNQFRNLRVIRSFADDVLAIEKGTCRLLFRSSSQAKY